MEPPLVADVTSATKFLDDLTSIESTQLSRSSSRMGNQLAALPNVVQSIGLWTVANSRLPDPPIFLVCRQEDSFLLAFSQIRLRPANGRALTAALRAESSNAYEVPALAEGL
jgi:hypothetical protein